MGTPHLSNVLFVCNSNSSRSIIAEAILGRIGDGRFRAYSAGSNPKAEINPHTFALLDRLGYSADGLHPKSWHDFTGAEAPEFDLIFTLCDEAAGEACPAFSGTPITAHWGIPDPEQMDGTPSEIAVAFDETHAELLHMIELLVALPVQSIDRLSLHTHLQEIGAAARA
ncbi:MAG: arsenate reductase ArsC [Bradyrhizobiaceae bacterium]|nr:arsenate reductase ArsC [Bradyrhizobiaceae bacterium]